MREVTGVSVGRAAARVHDDPELLWHENCRQRKNP